MLPELGVPEVIVTAALRLKGRLFKVFGIVSASEGAGSTYPHPDEALTNERFTSEEPWQAEVLAGSYVLDISQLNQQTVAEPSPPTTFVTPDIADAHMRLLQDAKQRSERTNK